MRAIAVSFFLVSAGMSAGVALAQADLAGDHYRAGVARYKAGQYADAISEFRAADAIRPSPVLSFNIAQCYEKSADLANAKSAYQDYLRRAPNADDRAAVEATIASIDQKLAQQQRDETVVLVPSTSADVQTQARPAPNYTLGATVGGVGVAGLIAAVALNAMSKQQSNSLQNDGLGGVYWSQSKAQGYYSNASSLWTGAIVAYIAGGVLTAAGVGILGYQLATKPSSAQVQVQ